MAIPPSDRRRKSALWYGNADAVQATSPSYIRSKRSPSQWSLFANDSPARSESKRRPSIHQAPRPEVKGLWTRSQKGLRCLTKYIAVPAIILYLCLLVLYEAVKMGCSQGPIAKLSSIGGRFGWDDVCDVSVKDFTQLPLLKGDPSGVTDVLKWNRDGNDYWSSRATVVNATNEIDRMRAEINQWQSFGTFGVNLGDWRKYVFPGFNGIHRLMGEYSNAHTTASILVLRTGHSDKQFIEGLPGNAEGLGRYILKRLQWSGGDQKHCLADLWNTAAHDGAKHTWRDKSLEAISSFAGNRTKSLRPLIASTEKLVKSLDTAQQIRERLLQNFEPEWRSWAYQCVNESSPNFHAGRRYTKLHDKMMCDQLDPEKIRLWLLNDTTQRARRFFQIRLLAYETLESKYNALEKGLKEGSMSQGIKSPISMSIPGALRDKAEKMLSGAAKLKAQVESQKYSEWENEVELNRLERRLLARALIQALPWDYIE